MANLTSKELTAIEDQLGLEFFLVKKYQSLAEATDDKKLRSKCNSIASKHQEHYKMLLGHLK